MRRQGHAQCGGHAYHRQGTSHRTIIAHAGALVAVVGVVYVVGTTTGFYFGSKGGGDIQDVPAIALNP